MIYYKKKSWIKRKLQNFIIKNENKKTFFKSGKVFVTLFAFLLSVTYLSYLFLIPYFANNEKIESYLNDYLTKNAKVSLDIEKPNIKPGWKFDINFSAKNIKLNYLKNEDFITIKNPTLDIDLISLILNTPNINKFKAENLEVRLKFTKKNKYEYLDYVNLDILDKFSSKKQNHKTFKTEIKNAQLIIIDENTNKNYFVNLDNTNLSYIGLNRLLTINTKGNIKTKNHLINNFALNYEYKSEKSSSSLKKFLKDLNYNPFAEADKYGLYFDSNIDLKLSRNKNKLTHWGEIEVSNLSFSLGDMHLPKNNFRINFKGDRILCDFDFNFIKNQYAKIKFKSLQNKLLELNIDSSEIDLSQLQLPLEAIAKIFNSKLNMSDINLKGILNANLYLRSNFKTTASNGIFKIQNAKITSNKLGVSLDNINSDINLANNNINIINTYAYFNDAKFNLNGTIDKNANANMVINSEEINIAKAINLLSNIPFLSDIRAKLNNYNFKTGTLKINSTIKGKIKAPTINSNSQLKNLGFTIKSKLAEIKIQEVLITTTPSDFKFNNAKISLKNILYKDKNINSTIKEVVLNLDDTNVAIMPFECNIEDIILKISGKILNYKNKNSELKLNIQSNIPAKNNLIYFDQKLNLQSNITLKDEKLSFSELYLLNSDKKIVTATGKITNLTQKDALFDNFRISINEKLKLTLPKLQNTSLEILGTINLNNKISKPDIVSDLNIYNLENKKNNIYINDLILNIKNNSCHFNTPNAQFANSNYSLAGNLNFSDEKIVIDSLDINSNYVNFNSLEKNSTKNSDTIPVEILNIKGNINQLDIYDLSFSAVNFKGKYSDSVLSLSSFSSEIFNGNLNGTVEFNTKTQETKAGILLKNINTRLLTNNIKQFSIATSGNLNAIIDASFKGNDFNDVLKTLNGYIKFNIQNGELTQFAKLERFLQAGNILSQNILKISLNSIISSISQVNTGDFSTIEGALKIKDATANIQYIKTKGTNMSLYIVGKIFLLANHCTVKILGRIPTSTVSVLGDIGDFSYSKIVNKMPNDKKELINNITSSPLEKMLSMEIDKTELEKIPDLDNQITSSREFLVIIDGLINDKSSIRQFKWIKGQ